MAAIKNVKLKVNTSGLEQLERQLDGLQRVINAQNAIWRRVCVKITPLVRSLLLDSWAKSDLKNRSFEMKNAIAMAIVYPTSKGIKIGLPRGKGEDFYRKAGALQYGSLRNSSMKNKTARAKVKRAGLASGYRPTGGGSFVLLAHPYFTLNSAQALQIQSAVEKALQEEIDAEVRKA